MVQTVRASESSLTQRMKKKKDMVVLTMCRVPINLGERGHDIFGVRNSMTYLFQLG